MKTTHQLKLMLSLVLICFTTGLKAQDTQELADELYQEYKENGVDAALAMYDKNPAKGDEYTVMSEPLNILAYRIMSDQDMDAAEKVFLAQIDEYPDRANPLDSYAEFLMEKGQNEKAKEYLRKSAKIAKDSDKEQEKREVYRTSKAKLAQLENKDRQLDFLVGNWDLNITQYQDGEENGNFSGFTSSAEYDEDNDMITFVMKNASGRTVGKRIVVYDALEDVYDMAYIDPNQPMGIQNSKVEVKNMGDKYEFIEHYTDREGKEKTARHELQKKPDGSIEWVIFDKSDDGTDWEKDVMFVYNKKST